MISFKAIGCVVGMLRTTGDCVKAEEGHWPLTPGEYDVKLMLDDGFTEAGSHKAQSSAMTLLAGCSVDKQAQGSINT